MSTTVSTPTSSAGVVAAAQTVAAAANEPLLVVDIGKKQSRKKIKDLRQGRGRLFEKVLETIGELKADGTIAGNVKPIVIVVRQREKAVPGFGVFR